MKLFGKNHLRERIISCPFEISVKSSKKVALFLVT
jgi:hypothetical protein